MRHCLILMLLFVMAASAADITGTWKGTVQTPNGPADRTFVFKVDGNKLTGETETEMMGKSAIKDGKIEGDTLSFSFSGKFQDQEVTLNYKGQVSGNEIKFSVAIAGGDQILEYTAKKIS